MHVYIDADGCPVVNPALDISKGAGVKCTLVCDTSHEIVREGADTVVVSKGKDSADFALVNLVKPGDIVITQDYGLAAMCLAKKARVLSQNGLVYNETNILGLLETRYASLKLRMSGKYTKGPSPRTKEQDEAFRRTFAMLLAGEDMGESSSFCSNTNLIR